MRFSPDRVSSRAAGLAAVPRRADTPGPSPPAPPADPRGKRRAPGSRTPPGGPSFRPGQALTDNVASINGMLPCSPAICHDRSATIPLPAAHTRPSPVPHGEPAHAISGDTCTMCWQGGGRSKNPAGPNRTQVSYPTGARNVSDDMREHSSAATRQRDGITPAARGPCTACRAARNRVHRRLRDCTHGRDAGARAVRGRPCGVRGAAACGETATGERAHDVDWAASHERCRMDTARAAEPPAHGAEPSSRLHPPRQESFPVTRTSPQ